jgi:uncharacterized spore protein YtfJ
MAGNFKEVVDSMLSGMDGFLSSKTVVGEPTVIGDTIIVPFVDVSFGVGAGDFRGEKKANGAGGLTGKMSPSAVLVIQNGTTRLVNIKNQDSMTKILDMVPDLVNRFVPKGDNAELSDDEIKNTAFENN